MRDVTLASDDAPLTVHVDAEGRIELLVRSGGLRIGADAEAFTIYEDGELAYAGTEPLSVASPGCTTTFAIVRGYVA